MQARIKNQIDRKRAMAARYIELANRSGGHHKKANLMRKAQRFLRQAEVFETAHQS